MNNHSIEVPTLRPSTGYAFDADLNTEVNGKRTLRGVDIDAPGKLFIVDNTGQTATYDFSGLTAGIPYRLILQIAKIVGNGSGLVGDGVTGTSIALANLHPLV